MRLLSRSLYVSVRATPNLSIARHNCPPNIPELPVRATQKPSKGPTLRYAGRGARTSTFALTNATLPYALKLANKGFQQAAKSDSGLSAGVNTYAGKSTYEAVALSPAREYTCSIKCFLNGCDESL